jgi:pimeloyl-ACP methyl ester carboxylesterase
MEKNGPVSSPRQVVLLLRGLRTFGGWQERLRGLLAGRPVEVVVYRYGRLGAPVFLVPGLRRLMVRRLQRFLREDPTLRAARRLDLVCHSFGSYLALQALAGLAPDEGPRVQTLILCGSVLKQSHPWAARVGPDRRVGRVINECGERDVWPTMAQLFVVGMGAAGRYGFAPGAAGPRVLDRFHPTLRHNDFFTARFMSRYWLPIFDRDGEPPEKAAASRPQPSWSSLVEPISEPLKLLFWLLLLGGLASLWM